jgi:hypothetical protein
MGFSQGWMVEVEQPVIAQPLLNLLNVKYLLVPTRIGLPPGLNFRVASRGDFEVVENLEVWPRAFFCNKVIPIFSTEAFIKYLVENGKLPFIALTLEEIDKHPAVQKLESTDLVIVSPATNFQLLPNSTAFDIHAASAGVVCLTESRASDFTATANNKPTPVLTVNRAFKGVYLDKPGDYHLVFTYRPRHWRLACVLFWIATGIIVALGFVSFIRMKILRKNSASP